MKVSTLGVILLSLVSLGCVAAPKVVPSKAEKIESCINRISNSTDADIEQAFEVCRQMYRLKKIN